MFILLTVCHTFPLSLTYSQNFPGPEALFQDFPVLKNQGLTRFSEPARTLFNSKPCCTDRLISRSKQNCESLTYLPSPGDERLLRIGKVSVIASDVRNIGKKIHNFFEESGEIIPKHRKIYRHRGVYKNYQSVKNVKVAIPTKDPAYLRRVSCGYAERSPPHFAL